MVDDEEEDTLDLKPKLCGLCGRVSAMVEGELVCPFHGRTLEVVPDRPTLPDPLWDLGGDESDRGAGEGEEGDQDPGAEGDAADLGHLP